MPVLQDFPAAKMDARKINEARRKSIAELLRQYNKKLTDEKAYDYAVLIMQACDKFGQDPFVIAALVVSESSARHDAVSRGGDYGLMQVRWRVHEKKIRNKYPHIAKAKDMLNPKDNLLVGTEIFSVYRATAKHDVRGALMYYSAGNKRMADKVFTLLAQLEKSYHERLRNI
jgi:soluble lytic murein transglycosylase-like protein